MVLPSSTAAEGEASSADWLSELRRWLHLGHKGVIVAIRDARPARLRELCEALEELEPGFTFTTRAEDIADCTPGALVLLALGEQDLEWLNLNRPLFSQLGLRAVLWVEAPLSSALKFRAPDLHDWISHFVHCPPGVPRFAVEGLRVGLRWWPGVAWRGKGLEWALEEVGVGSTQGLDASADFAALVAALSASRTMPIRWVGITTARSLWRLRWALARAGHQGPNILDNPTVEAPGWFEIHSHQSSLAEAASCLLRAGVSEPRKAAALLELESGRIHARCGGAAHEGGDVDDETLARVALLRAPPHVQRAWHDHPRVLEKRRDLVHRMRLHPSEGWSRFELALFASLERDRLGWPAWRDVRFLVWMIEHRLRVGANPVDQRIILEVLSAMGETSVERAMATEWGRPASSRGPEDGIATRLSRMPSTDIATAHDEPDALLALADDLGWDAPLVTQTLANVLRRLVARGHRDRLISSCDRVLDAASSQLGAADPAFLVISRITGIALGSAGLFDRASKLLRHAWDPLAPPLDHAAAELGMTLAALGRFSEASTILALASHADERIVQARRFVLQATGESGATTPSNQQTLDIESEARLFLQQRLLAFEESHRA